MFISLFISSPSKSFQVYSIDWWRTVPPPLLFLFFCVVFSNLASTISDSFRAYLHEISWGKCIDFLLYTLVPIPWLFVMNALNISRWPVSSIISSLCCRTYSIFTHIAAAVAALRYRNRCFFHGNCFEFGLLRLRGSLWSGKM